MRAWEPSSRGNRHRLLLRRPAYFLRAPRGRSPDVEHPAFAGTPVSADLMPRTVLGEGPMTSPGPRAASSSCRKAGRVESRSRWCSESLHDQPSRQDHGLEQSARNKEDLSGSRIHVENAE